jgi:hypothetical protein
VLSIRFTGVVEKRIRLFLGTLVRSVCFGGFAIVRRFKSGVSPTHKRVSAGDQQCHLGVAIRRGESLPHFCALGAQPKWGRFVGSVLFRVVVQPARRYDIFDARAKKTPEYDLAAIESANDEFEDLADDLEKFARRIAVARPATQIARLAWKGI